MGGTTYRYIKVSDGRYLMILEVLFVLIQFCLLGMLLKSGEILEVVIDNPPPLDTVPEVVRASGH